MEIYSNQWFWIILCISSKVPCTPFTKTYNVAQLSTHNSTNIFFKVTIHDGGHMCEMVSLII